MSVYISVYFLLIKSTYIGTHIYVYTHLYMYFLLNDKAILSQFH